MRQFIFTATIMASLTSNACAQEVAGVEPQATINENNQASTQPKASARKDDESNLPKRFQDLDARDISREEIYENIALEEKQRKKYRKNEKDLRKAIAVWKQTDSSIRGQRPKIASSDLDDEESKRLQELRIKWRKAKYRKDYEVYVPTVLSQEEADELTALQQAELDIRLEQKRKFQAWTEQDKGTRGAIPNISAIYQYDSNPRLRELLRKTLKTNQDILNRGDNTLLSDTERFELSELKNERRRINSIYKKVSNVIQNDSPSDWQKSGFINVMNTLPKDFLQRSINVERRIEEIEGPHDAEKKADRIKIKLMRLSRETGITISSDEIDETIRLNAVKDRIRRRTKRDGLEKWLAEGGDYIDIYTRTDEDEARWKEIDARLREISAPLDKEKKSMASESGPYK